MASWTRLRSAARHLLRRSRSERELDEELRGCLEELVEEKLAAGLDLEAARRAAARELGGIEQIKEEVRDARAGAWLEGWARDLALAGRSLRRAPGLAAVVAATLALGIGASTAMFSVARAVLLAPLPYRDPGQLFLIWSDLDKAGYLRAPLSGPELQDLREESRLFQGFAAIWCTTAPFTGEGDPEQVRIGLVTPDFFDVLGVAPLLGRGFEPADEGRKQGGVVLLSWSLWQRRYGGDPGIVGRAIRVSGRTATVVGVMPRRLAMLFPADANVPPDLEAWAPFATPVRSTPRSLYYLRTIARATPGTTPEQAREEIAAISARVVPRHTEYTGSGRRFYAVPLREDLVREARPALLALGGGVAILLLIACVNVANVLLARALGEQKEAVLRVALGASRRHLARHYLARGLLLAAAGGGAGLLAAGASLRLLLSLRPDALPRLDEAHLSLPVLGFTLVVSLLSGLLFSLAPLRVAFHVDLRGALASGGRGAAHLGRRTRAALVVSQVALGVVLLVGAGLLVRTFLRARQVDPGYRSSGVLTFRLSLPEVRYPTADAATTFARELEARLRALPGVEAVGAVSHLPLDHLPNWSTPYSYDAIAGEPPGGHEADARAVSPGFFAAIGARLVEGRPFEEADDEHRRKVVIVDESLARKAWPGESALGKTLRVEFMRDGDFVPTPATVVGVVRHLRHRSLMREVREQVYEPYRQSIRDPMAYLVRSRTDPGRLAAVVRSTVAGLDKELPVYDVRPLDDYVASALAPQRFVMSLGALFAAVALLLASVGTYGVIAGSVSSRRHEFGVRRAVGAGALHVLGLVLREGLALSAAGLVLGFLAAALAAPSLASLLFGVSPFDGLTYAGVLVAQVLATVLACGLPARRAATSDPLEVLRAL